MQSTSLSKFKTYEAYENFLDRSLPIRDRPCEDSVWLAQLQADGKTMQWFRFTLLGQSNSEGFEDRGTGASAYKITHSKIIFQEQLSTKAPTILQQVVLMVYQETLDPDHNPLGWAADVVGLGLDMPPSVWNHVRGRMQEIRDWTPDSPIPWIENCQILDIGNYSLVSVEPSAGRPPTGMAACSQVWVRVLH
jgi:hypothetical protein